jgi:predicted enzyme related to lactoylglutathione lyase
VLGWKSKDMSGPGGTYTIVSAGPADVGGIWTMPREMASAGTGATWLPYIGVDDVDGFTKRVQAAGGAVKRAPEDIPGIGRFSVVADPQGAPFMLMTPASREARPTVPPETPGHVGWRELHAGEGAAAFGFYSELFGWTKGEALDIGPMGVYQEFFTNDEPTGGMMTKMPQSPMPFWMLYFNVPGAGRRDRAREDGRWQTPQRADAGANGTLDRAVHGSAGRDVRADRTEALTVRDGTTARAPGAERPPARAVSMACRGAG